MVAVQPSCAGYNVYAQIFQIYRYGLLTYRDSLDSHSWHIPKDSSSSSKVSLIHYHWLCRWVTSTLFIQCSSLVLTESPSDLEVSSSRMLTIIVSLICTSLIYKIFILPFFYFQCCQLYSRCTVFILEYRFFKIYNNYKYKHHCDLIVFGLSHIFFHASYGRRHFVPSAVLLAGVYASPTESALAGVWALPAPTAKPAFCRYRQEEPVFHVYKSDRKVDVEGHLASTRSQMNVNI